MSDCISFIILICALSWIMTYSFNKCGYDFKVVDTALISIVGVLLFLIPYGLVRFIASII